VLASLRGVGPLAIRFQRAAVRRVAPAAAREHSECMVSEIRSGPGMQPLTGDSAIIEQQEVAAGHATAHPRPPT
jgi:hypothetical protein